MSDASIESSGVSPVSSAPPGLTRRLLRNPMGAASIGVLTVIVVASVFAPLLTSADPTQADLNSILARPGEGHLLGADGAGRDIWARLLYGGRISLLAGLLAAGVAVAIGVPSGLVGGYVQGRFDTLLSWVSDTLMSVPAIVLLFAVIAAFGSGTWVTMTVFGFLLAPSFYRLIRSSVRAVRAELYVDAAQVSGLTDARIIRRHVVRVVRAPIIIQASFVAGVAIVLQAGLAFLGLGDTNSPNWGAMLGDAFANIYSAPRLMVWPGAMIGLTVGALAVLGTALRDTLEDPAAGRRRRTRPMRAETVTPSQDVPDATKLLNVVGLNVSYERADGMSSVVVDHVDLELARGEVLGLVGESGFGKTQTAFALMGLLPTAAEVSATSYAFDGRWIELEGGVTAAKLRGRRIGYVPQEPMTNLDPSYRVGAQLVEPLRLHLGLSKKAAKAKALSLLADVGITEPDRVFSAFPHEISGGMAQRVLIAGAISCDPDILIADEPTTALDVTVQLEVLDVLRNLQRDRGLAILLVTHDFGVVADLCSRVAVMKVGRIVETADVETLFADPQHAYTRELLAAADHDAPIRTYEVAPSSGVRS